jgi:hypothetical protein
MIDCFLTLDLLYIYIINLLERRIHTENIPQIILHGIRAGYLFSFENPKNLGFLCSLLESGAARPLRSLFSDHQASPVAISDLIGSPGFAGDHLGFPSASWLSPGLAVTLSDSPAPPSAHPSLRQFSVALGFLRETTGTPNPQPRAEPPLRRPP